jgi:serralysin
MAGNDVITGFQGDDTLTGGPDADIFVFRAGDGNDLITDLEVGVDALVLKDVTIDATSEEDANGDMVIDTILDLSSGETIVLAGVTGITDPGDLIA